MSRDPMADLAALAEKSRERFEGFAAKLGDDIGQHPLLVLHLRFRGKADEHHPEKVKIADRLLVLFRPQLPEFFL